MAVERCSVSLTKPGFKVLFLDDWISFIDTSQLLEVCFEFEDSHLFKILTN